MSDEHKPNNAADIPAQPTRPEPPTKSEQPGSSEQEPASKATEGTQASDAGAVPTSTADPGASTPSNKPTTPGWAKAAIGALAVIAVAAGAGGYALGKNSATSSLPEAGAAYIGGPSGTLDSLDDVHRVNPDDPFAIGSEDAKVVISYFADLTCPVCAYYTQSIEPKLVEEYVDKGLVRIEWNDFPFLSKDSRLAAQGGRAAAAQGKFWEYKKAVYDGFGAEGRPTYTVDDLVGFAKQAGVSNLDEFRADLDSGKYASTVMQALIYGGYLGVSGTPTFVVNGVVIQGDTEYDVLKDAIEQSLEKGKPDEQEPPAEHSTEEHSHPH
ncbi:MULTISPECIES: DsbA family protein [unclassified Corynebacterium]|uniref:DsbA family protein n=1 Tax=unclassified Corynebacterium TaxID=2624378 RepID=UPI0029CA9F5C|nr:MULTISPECIES: thioredoxin domain-containing protein [unclassified Corynebacterium]WPF66357.1 thioredoxin domain-containing protein [Corynebacterium sp. 22KM0430]WPF68847.1 thioredoxin domain-containing protein [Corynebacterium sp. 21KM1197]